jgi:sterol desaturase/sphingolipid hydroxylase (fatty acid hydroxylase superfamily)
MSNLFGLHRGRLIGEPPAYVDKSLAPGFSRIPSATLTQWLYNSPLVLINSPNFVWATISLLMYFLVPYDLTSSYLDKPLSYEFISLRFPFWLSIVFAYTGFWHINLNLLKLGDRPFIKNRLPNCDKLVHNIFWSTSGVLIWTGFENVFCHLWATGRLPYMADSEILGIGGLRFLATLMGIPLWRSIHFYFAHRLLHFGPLYQQVHSLHHRNTDVEPFAGLCMHPVEHLYYYSCILPSLFYCSPHAFLWNGVHLLLAPAASHSGWEDHFHSDAYHYLHHRYLECNYSGSDASFMDVAFGTFKDSADSAEPRDDAKSTLRTIPTLEFATYLTLSGSCVYVWYYQLIPPIYAALSLGFGPVILASMVSHVFKRSRLEPVKMSMLGNLLHLAMGTLFCSIPIAYTGWLVNKN